MNEIGAAATSIRSVARDAMTGLRHEVMEFRLDTERAERSAATAVAVTLSVVIALMVRVDAPWWAAISAFVSVQATAPASLRRGILRIVGTAIGAAIGFFLSPWMIEDQVALCLTLLTVGALGTLGYQVSDHGYAWLLGAVTVVMVVLAAVNDPSSAFDVACNRTGEVMIGTITAIVVTVLLMPDDGKASVHPPRPGWSDLLGQRWPSVEHALRAGLGIALVPLVWRWLELPNLAQTAITAAAVMAVPDISDDKARTQQKITERSIHRFLGCLVGGIAGLLCLALSVETFLIWLLMLATGIWINSHVQTSARGIGYVGTQGAVVFICTLVQNWGPPTSIAQGIERFAGITGGLVIVLIVSLLTAPSSPPATD